MGLPKPTDELTMRLLDPTRSFVLRPSQCQYHWLDSARLWRFADIRFMELRELFGFDSHVIHIHDRFHKKIVDGRPFIGYGPIIEFDDPQVMLQFKLAL